MLHRTYCTCLLLLCLIFFSACVYDNLENCPQGIRVQFYSKTACRTDTIYPPVSDLKLCVFDRNGRLVSYREDSRVAMQRDYVQTLQAANGIFTVVAWGGLTSDVFQIEKPKVGETTKNDLLFRLKRVAQTATLPGGQRIYYGESPVVYLPDPAEYGSVFEYTKINLQEITNRLNISVEGLDTDGDYEIIIESANASMNFDGRIAADETVRYSSPARFSNTDLETQCTLLKLETGYNNLLIINDKTNNRELFRGDLLGTLLLKNPNINLACDHDFTIRFKADDFCSCGNYVIIQILVNDWLVHSYETNL